MFISFGTHAEKGGYAELSQAIIEAVQSGRLAANSPLPPSRVLAESLGVSRDTVVRCYRHLKSLGWIESHSTRGTYITGSALPPAPAQNRLLDQSRLSRYTYRFVGHAESDSASAGSVVFSAAPKEFLPNRRWKSVMQQNAEGTSAHEPLYDRAVLGRSELRTALSAFLNRSRGIACTADEVAVFNVSFSALSLICRLFLDPGDIIAMEEPGFGGVREVASYLGLQVLPLELDESGLSVDALQNSRQQVKAVYVTANHQEPTGITMTLARRKQLLAWAQKNNAMIIEDDYDGLFHYGANLPPSLKSMDAQDNVIYLSSFWQALYPLTTLCFAVLPLPFVEIVQQAKLRTASLTESLPQVALAEMLDSGYLQKHVRKVERELSLRRRTLIYELKRAFGAQISLPSHSCGMTIMARFQNCRDNDLLKAAQQAGLPVVSTDTLYSNVEKRPAGELSFYFPGLPESLVRKTVLNFASLLGASESG